MKKKFNNRWQLVIYDAIVLMVINDIMLVLYGTRDAITAGSVFTQVALSFVLIIPVRLLMNVYRQIWRYGGIQCYLRLMAADAIGAALFLILAFILPVERITFTRIVSLCCLNLLASLAMRMLYRYAFKFGTEKTPVGRFLNLLLRVFAGSSVEQHTNAPRKINVAIFGAGRVGVTLAEELLFNAASAYHPCCFVDVNSEKIGREIHGIHVLSDDEHTFTRLKDLEVQEVVLAIPNMNAESKKKLFDRCHEAGYAVKIYDYPVMETGETKRQMREFDVSELLFRKEIDVINDRTRAYYEGKTVLITGGGGSIGSEICRQLAKMNVRRLVLVDIYENGAYDVQQELRLAYKNRVEVDIEIVSITNEKGMRRVFEAWHPDILINAAAHKHVPLMEHNCVEAVENNVFGCEVLLKLCREYGTPRFMMVSTDKAVNPTNVMGATKRMCEMMVLAEGSRSGITVSCTRFGNVLGSAGSVIPLFRRQIMNGGPITITDKRIIRYFMTIPEASQLVLESGAMAKNGELFVLDMGKPVKILDLAENLIRLSGMSGIEIIETGLRPGEKLYEELLVKTEELDKTDNSLIFIERDQPCTLEEVADKLRVLRAAVSEDDDNAVREALKKVVPTYHDAEEVNRGAEQAREMKETK